MQRQPLGIATRVLYSLLAFAAFGQATTVAAAPVEVQSSSPSSLDSFETAQPGPFDELPTKLGTWRAEMGRVVIDDKHAKSGRHCLQLAGGNETEVTLRLADHVDTSGMLTFWAERWTGRDPFRFRISKDSGKGWKEIYNGDDKVRVGREFLNDVKVELDDPDIERLRFTCASPPDTGVLIDDLRIAPLRQQRVVSVEAVPVTLPALVGTAASPLIKLRVVTEGSLQPLSLTAVKAELLDKTGAADPSGLFVYRDRWESGLGSQPWDASPAGKVAGGGKGEMRWFTAPRQASELRLGEGSNTIWVACRIRENANVDHRIGVRIGEVAFSSGRNVSVDGPLTLQRMGVALRQAGDAGVHTYRIPGLATTKRGTLIGVYDVRHRSGGDLPGDIDVGMIQNIELAV